MAELVSQLQGLSLSRSLAAPQQCAPVVVGTPAGRDYLGSIIEYSGSRRARTSSCRERIHIGKPVRLRPIMSPPTCTLYLSVPSAAQERYRSRSRDTKSNLMSPQRMPGILVRRHTVGMSASGGPPSAACPAAIERRLRASARTHARTCTALATRHTHAAPPPRAHVER